MKTAHCAAHSMFIAWRARLKPECSFAMIAVANSLAALVNRKASSWMLFPGNIALLLTHTHTYMIPFIISRLSTGRLEAAMLARRRNCTIEIYHNCKLGDLRSPTSVFLLDLGQLLCESTVTVNLRPGRYASRPTSARFTR
jgi:hypothetical protein